MIRGQSGSAELRVNDLPPMKSSVFFNGSPTIQDSAAHLHATADYTTLVIQMSESDLVNCDALAPHIDIEGEPPIDTQLHAETLAYSTDDVIVISDEGSVRPYRTSFRTKDGIFLRSFLVIKNIGTTDLSISGVLLDGELCYSAGIEAVNCGPASISPNETYLLELRYQPDFTMSLIRKTLTLVTSIGDLDYIVEVRIPCEMLLVCRDSLPRSPIEGYLFYLGLALVFMLIIVMLLTSMIESRAILKYQYQVYRRIHAFNEDKKPLLDQEPQDMHKNEYEAPSTKVRNKSNENKTKNLTKVEPINNHNHRNLGKSLSSPRSFNNSDSSTSSSSSGAKKAAVVEKSIGEKTKKAKSGEIETSLASAISEGEFFEVKPKARNSFVKQASTPPLTTQISSEDGANSKSVSLTNNSAKATKIKQTRPLTVNR